MERRWAATPTQSLPDLRPTALSSARFRLAKLTSRLLLTQQQVDLSTQAGEKLRTDLKAWIEAVRPGVGEEVLGGQFPTSDFSEIGDKVMLLLGRDRAWSAFKVRGR